MSNPTLLSLMELQDFSDSVFTPSWCGRDPWDLLGKEWKKSKTPTGSDGVFFLWGCTNLWVKYNIKLVNVLLWDPNYRSLVLKRQYPLLLKKVPFVSSETHEIRFMGIPVTVRLDVWVSPFITRNVLSRVLPNFCYILDFAI